MDNFLAVPFTLTAHVPKRPHQTAPTFGAWLSDQRGRRSAEAIARQIRPLVSSTGLKVDPSLIHKIENGRVPSWPMLIAFSRVYRVSLDELMQRLATALDPTAADLLRHGTEVIEELEPSSYQSVTFWQAKAKTANKDGPKTPLTARLRSRRSQVRILPGALLLGIIYLTPLTIWA